MRVDILAIGSRGDVQPYVALGLGLQMAGHQVRIVTLGGFEELVRGRGLDHLVIGERPSDIANTEEGRDWVRMRTSPWGFLRGFVRVADKLIEAGIQRYSQFCHDVEALISSPMGLLVGAQLAEWLQVPILQAHLAPPVFPSSYDWDGRKTLGTAIRGRLRAPIHSAFRVLIWSKLRGTTNAARRNVLGLAALPLTDPFTNLGRRRIPLLGAYSPSLAAQLPDWGDWVHVTGFWFLDHLPGWKPPAGLTDFLASGPAPVFVGFGSTPFPRPDETTDLIVRALKRTRHRGLLVAGGSGLAVGRLTDDVISVDSVPHTWLFPQVCTAVHHGGAGVTGAVLRAGLASVVVPVFGDQPFWGKRVFQLGAGPRPIAARHLTEERLTRALQAATSDKIRHNARALGQRIREEDGVARAVEVIHQYVGKANVNLARTHPARSDQHYKFSA